VLFSKLLAVLDPEPHSAPLNMAIDEILLRQADEPCLRIYRWSEPAVSFGYFERIDGVETMALGRDLVRRWTGGGIVEHGDDLTYTLLIPRGHPFFRYTAPESYRLIHEVIAGALADEGMSTQLVAVAAPSTAAACFTSPVQHDLVAGGIKIAGAAQRRTRWGLLHQGSIQTRRQPCPALAEKLAHAFGEKTSKRYLTAQSLESAVLLAENKYAALSWLRKY
jgi:lipoate-protein ligase A